MRRATRRHTARIALLTTMAFGLTAAVPPGALPEGDFPLSWLWSWVAQRPAWSDGGALVGLPRQKEGRGPVPDAHVPASATDAKNGVGRAPTAAAGTLPAYRPHQVDTRPTTTPAAPIGYDAKTSRRLSDKASPRSDVFTNADGSVTRRTYTRPVNFRAGDGTWKAIDNDFVRRADGRLHNTANSLRVSIDPDPAAGPAAVAGRPGAPEPATSSVAPSAGAAEPGTKATELADDLATVTLPTGESVSYRLDGAAPATAEVNGNTATYRGILPQTDLQLQAFDAGIKETLVLHSADAASSWVFPLRLSGLTPRLTDAGSVELLNADGKAVGWFPKGWMEDSKVDPRSGAPAQSGDVDFEIVQHDGAPALKVVADQAWLRDPARQYPVRVDPTTTTLATGDVFVDNDASTTNQNGDNLPVGTYNSGTVKARSFIHLDDFDNDGLMGKRVTSAYLKLYMTWAYSCTVYRPVSVHKVNTDWTAAGLATAAFPGPSISASIGSVTPTDHTPACTNDTANRSIGQWITVPLDVATFNGWSTGGANYGLALTASETDSNAWKRFTSANYQQSAYAPHLVVNYANNVAPQIDVRYPDNAAVMSTLTPQLLVRGSDPDNWPGKGLTYRFVVYDAAGTVVTSSAFSTATAWTVPAGKLRWNQAYLYTVQAYDTVSYSAVSPAYAFTTAVTQPHITANLAQNAGKGYDPSIGNYTTSATDATIATVGPSLAVARSYNSLDTRRSSAFGLGWSSVLDMRATPVLDATGAVQAVVVRYPTGEEVAYGRDYDGTFAAPPGRFATFREVKSGSTVTGYTLTDKDASVHTFARAAGDGSFRLSSISDANGRTLQISFDDGGNPHRLQGASGRSIYFTWRTPTGSTLPHVAEVYTDPVVPGDWNTTTVWEYTYGADDRLVKVCAPTSWDECWTYNHTATSQYSNAVLNADPYSYWRLAEQPGATVAASEVRANAGVDNAQFVNTTLGQTGGLAGSTATAAGFNGTSSYLRLPGDLITDSQYQSIGLWFKTSTPNGVLFSYSTDPVSKGSTTASYVPALYIGSDGKLRGQLWTGAVAPITTATAVTDGQWHHVVLAGNGNTQTLYLDGVAKGSLAGTITLPDNGAANMHVGAGFVGGGWPGHARTGANPPAPAYLTGSVSDVSFFNRALTASTVSALHRAGAAAHPALSAFVRPSGGVSAQIAYDTTTGTVRAVTDQNGATWTLGRASVAGSSRVYAASVLGAKPADYWRLGEVGVVNAVNEVRGGTATYNQVTLGAAGPFTDATAATFNGTSSHLRLPDTDIPAAGPTSVEMWFKAPLNHTAGGVLFGYQGAALHDPAGAGAWTPALYLGTDGKLRGQFWNGTIAPITTATAVTDGKWHHVALSAGAATQSLYLDGVHVGTIDKALIAIGATGAYVGASKWDGAWPAKGAGPTGYFTGSIADVAYHQTQLTAAQVSAHVAAAKQAAPIAVTMIAGVGQSIAMPVSTVAVTGPKQEKETFSYDLVNGSRLVAQTDSLGNTTKFGYDVGGFASLVYDPRGVWTQSLQDVRGNTRQVITCQDQSGNKCSSVYYTYHPDATTAAPPADPRNDLLLTVRDGRSASATDNTYLTTYGYDARGNRTTITDALGRVTTTSFTDGTSVVAYDGGYAPAGLPTTVTTAGGARQSVRYYATGDVAEVTYPTGKVVRLTYDGHGRMLTQTEITDTFPNGLVTTYAYDRLGRTVTETEPAVTNRVTGAVHTNRTTTTYSPDGEVRTVTEEDLTGGDAPRTEEHVYNARGQETVSYTPTRAATRFEYDAYGQVVTETEPDGTTTRNTYDTEGNLLTTTLVGYTGHPGNPEAARDVVISAKSYDPAGRLASEVDAMNWTTAYTYTDNGLEATTTRSDGTTRFVVEDNTYDAAGNLTKQVTNNGATTVTHTYDAADRPTSTTLDPAGLKRTTAYTYDRDDNVVTTRRTDGTGTLLGRTDAIYNADGDVLAETTYASVGGTAPVGRWQLDETTGTRAADSGGNNTATATGDTSWSTAHGGSAQFGGTGYLEATGPAVDTARSYTVSAWVKLDDTSRDFAAVSQDGTRTSGFFLQYHRGTDRWSFMLPDNDTDSWGGAAAVMSTAAPQTGTWTHLTAVHDATAKVIKLYVDGVLQGEQPFTPAWSALGTLNIGRGLYAGYKVDTWIGSISDVQVYQQALTSAEVSGVQAGTLPAANTQAIRTSYKLDQDGQAVAVTDPNGNTTYVAYDEAGNAVKTVSPAAPTERAGQGQILANAVEWTGYNTFDEITDTRDANGNWSVTGYDADGRVTSERSPSYTAPGSSTTVTPQVVSEYTATGQLSSVTDPLGNTTRYGYDQLDRLTSMTAANGGVTTYRYNLLGDLLSVTDPTGASNTSTWDYLGREETSTDVVRQTGAHHTTAYTYGHGGWLAEERSPAGVTTATAYNAAGEPVSVRDGAGNITRYGYDGAGRNDRVTRPDGTYNVTYYDDADRPTGTASFTASGVKLRTESSRYDAAGNVVASTDAKGTTTTFRYDATGALTGQTQPISGSDAIETSFGYDLNGNRTRFTDGRGNAFLTTYNSWNLPESQIEPATTAHPNLADRTFTLAYDAAGRPVRHTMPGGVTVTNVYDEVGQLRRQSGDGAEAATEDRTFDYDLAGRTTKLSGTGGVNTLAYDDRDLLTAVTGPSGDSSFTYDADGNMASRRDAAGTTAYGYDTAGRLSSLSNPAAGVQQAYTYNSLSQVKQITYGSNGNRRHFTFDDLHRLTGDELQTSAGAPIAKITYGWDANDNIVSKATTGFAGSATNTYTYDKANRLTSWNNGSSITAYAYDKSGNRLQNGAKLFTYDERNRLKTANSTGYQYTARGTLAYAGGQTTTADAFGQVVSQQTANGGTQTYRYDGLGRVIRDSFAYSGLENDLAGDGTATYVRGPSGELAATSAGATHRYTWTDLHTDVVGQFTTDGTALTGSTTYDPLGKVLATAGLLGNLGYQSEWTDAQTNRVNMHARWYNADTGQFDTRDTATNSPVPNSINANRYQYGDANPLTVIDPTGHWGISSLFKSVSSAVTSTVSRVTSSVSSYTSSFYNYASRAVSSVKSTAKKAVSTVKKTVSKTWSSTKRYVSKSWSSTKKYVSKSWSSAKKYVSKSWSSIKTKVKKTYNKAAKYVKKKVQQGKKWVAEKAAKVKKAVKRTVNTVKQAGKKVIAKAARTVHKAASTVRDGVNSVKKFVVEHKDTLLEIGAIAAAVVAGIACTAVTAGVGALACMVGAGALINLAKDAAQGDIRSVGDALTSVGTGALTGLAGGAGGAIASRIGAAVAGRVGTGITGRLATEAVENGTDEVLNQAVTTGRVDARTAVLGMVPGMGQLARSRGRTLSGASTIQRSGGSGITVGGGASCRTHSFDPATRVLMADGSKRPISDVNAGDAVAATDPATGNLRSRVVTQLHRNVDKNLTDVTVKRSNGAVATLKTTPNHPFWNDTDKSWTHASNLMAGTKLRTANGETTVVQGVHSYAGLKEMRDLTVADVHTYYVLAGETPVLVHNCDRAGMDFTDAERQKVYDANLEANNGVLTCEYCGREVVRRSSERGVPGRPDDAQIDHIEPKADNGHGGAHNGAVACRRCNRDKSTKPLEVWDGELRELLG